MLMIFFPLRTAVQKMTLNQVEKTALFSLTLYNHILVTGSGECPPPPPPLPPPQLAATNPFFSQMLLSAMPSLLGLSQGKYFSCWQPFRVHLFMLANL